MCESINQLLVDEKVEFSLSYQKVPQIAISYEEFKEEINNQKDIKGYNRHLSTFEDLNDCLGFCSEGILKIAQSNPNRHRALDNISASIYTPALGLQVLLGAACYFYSDTYIVPLALAVITTILGTAITYNKFEPSTSQENKFTQIMSNEIERIASKFVTNATFAQRTTR